MELYVVKRDAEILGCFTDKREAIKFCDYHAAELVECVKNPKTPHFDYYIYYVLGDLEEETVDVYRMSNATKPSDWFEGHSNRFINKIIAAKTRDEAMSLAVKDFKKIRAGKLKVLGRDRKTYVFWSPEGWRRL